MDADIVREVEFGRKLRGYDMAEVDAFLEKVETWSRKTCSTSWRSSPVPGMPRGRSWRP